ncbi:MAG: sigma-70 family RNA polymerase sigma factor [Planctomycetota bacterium]
MSDLEFGDTNFGDSNFGDTGAGGTDSEDTTEWIRRAKNGDDEAAQRLWTRYVDRLVSLARRKLPERNRRAADEEDVVQSVFQSFFQRAREGRFPQLSDRDDLWSLLVVITHRKAINQSLKERADKRGGGKLRGESILAQPGATGEGPPGFDALFGSEPTPDFALEVAEEFEELLASLATTEQRQVACLKMEGFTVEEIAERLGKSSRSVSRKLVLVRARLETRNP